MWHIPGFTEVILPLGRVSLKALTRTVLICRLSKLLHNFLVSPTKGIMHQYLRTITVSCQCSCSLSQESTLIHSDVSNASCAISIRCFAATKPCFPYLSLTGEIIPPITWYFPWWERERERRYTSALYLSCNGDKWEIANYMNNKKHCSLSSTIKLFQVLSLKC